MLKLCSKTSTKTGVAPNRPPPGGRGEGEGWHQHRIAPGDPFTISASNKASVPLATPMVFRAAERGKLAEFGDLRAHDVSAVVDDAQDRLVHRHADAAALRAEIDELDLRHGLRRDLGLGFGAVRHQLTSSNWSGPAAR
jgi:hypothetical protein